TQRTCGDTRPCTTPTPIPTKRRPPSFAPTEGDDALPRGAAPMNADPLAIKLLARSCRIGAMFVLSLASIVAFCGPIHDAARKGDQAKAVALLKQNPELVFSRDKFGNTPLHVAALHNQSAVAALLLANGADPNARNSPQASWFSPEKNRLG